MLVVIPVVSYIVLVLLWKDRLRHVGTEAGLFRILSLSLVEWMLFLYAMTEVLSLWNGISNESLAALWGAFAGTCLVEWSIFHFTVYAGDKTKTEEKTSVLFTVSRQWKGALLLFVLIGISVLGLSLYTVPYNWDSLAYHLPRICQWEANGSVSFFATGDERQISSPPLAEMAELHLYMLSGHNWRLLNLIQTFSYLFCAVGIFSITRELNCSRKLSVLSTLVYMTMPIVFGEAISTQNDLFAAVWLIIFVSEWILLLKDPKKIGKNRYTYAHALLLGCCMGLAYLAKTSVLIAMAIFLVILLAVLLGGKVRFSCVLINVLIAAAAAIVIVFPEIMRTYGLYGTIFVSEGIIIGSFKPGYLVLNFFKNFLYNLPNRLIPDSTWIMFIVSYLSGLLGIDLNDPAISFNSSWLYEPADATDLSHDTAGNPLILWAVIFLALTAIFIRVRTKRKMETCTIEFTLASIASFLLFCVILRFQPWGSRLMAPYLSILCPCVGALIQYICDANTQRKETNGNKELENVDSSAVSVAAGGSFQTGMTWILLLLSLTGWISLCFYHFELQNDMDISDDAVSRMYYWQQSTYEGDRQICDYITEQGYSLVGIYHAGQYEFPLWVMLDGTDARIIHVFVSNVTQVLVDEDAPPDCIIWKVGEPEEEVIVYQGRIYIRQLYTNGAGGLYVRADRV